MIIKEKLLPVNPFSRPGHRRPDTLGIVYHWVGAAGQENDATARYFELLSNQDLDDEDPDRYASAHYIIGMDGEIIRCIPDEEVAYHVGARRYTALAQRQFHGYTSNERRATPNWCTIGIELNHPDWTGEFTEATLEAAVSLGKSLLRTHLLGSHDVYRHYDITGKLCPKWFVKHEAAWLGFRDDIFYQVAER